MHMPVYMCVPWHAHASQRTICGNLFSPSTTWVVGTKEVISVDGECLYLLNHLERPDLKTLPMVSRTMQQVPSVFMGVTYQLLFLSLPVSAHWPQQHAHPTSAANRYNPEQSSDNEGHLFLGSAPLRHAPQSLRNAWAPGPPVLFPLPSFLISLLFLGLPPK